MDRVKFDDEGKFDALYRADSLRFVDNMEALALPERGAGGQRHLLVDSRAFGQLCGRIKAPTDYMNRMLADYPSQVATLLNAGLRELGEKRVLLRCKNDHIRAALSDRYSIVDNRHLATVAAEQFEGMPHQLRWSWLNEGSFGFKVTFEDHGIEDPSVPGSHLYPGVVCRTSEVGHTQVMLTPFTFRQSCTNDAVAVTSGQTLRRHVGKLSLDQLRIDMGRTIAKSIRSCERMLDTVLLARDVKLADPVQSISGMARLLQFNSRQTARVQAAFAGEPEATAWGAINAITAAAQLETPDLRLGMEEAAGRLLHLPTSELLKRFEDFDLVKAA